MKVYRFLYTVLLTIVAPFFLIHLYRKKNGVPRIGKRWKEHFGKTPPLKTLTATESQVIWIHAVSVGETLAVSPFIKRLSQAYPTARLVLTTTTPTGAEAAKKLDMVEHRYMPFDFPFAIRGFIKSINPNQLIIVETELWPNLLHIARRSNIKTSLINARLSQKSFNGYNKIQAFVKLTLPNIANICCQHDSDKSYFKQLGATEEQLAITGSIKYDLEVPQNVLKSALQLRQQIGNRPVWIAASRRRVRQSYAP